MAKKPLVIVSEPIHPDAVAALSEQAEVRLATGWDEDSLAASLAGAQALILRGLGRATRRVLAASP